VRAEAETWAATIAGYSSSAVQATKRLATFSRRLSSAELAEIEGMRSFVESQDHYKEGAASFTNRTKEDKGRDKSDLKGAAKAVDTSHGEEHRHAAKRKADPTGA
jgi:hypothetical protein